MKDTRELERRLVDASSVTSWADADAQRAEAAAALAEQRAEIEALTIILDLCTEGTDWTYAQVPDELASQREELERLRWIPVSERLPEPGVHVLVYPDGPLPIRWLKSSGEWFFNALPVTHWMPIPAAPATEKEK